MAKGDISHTGRVVSVNPMQTTVEILSSSACASCHAAGLCGMGEYQKKAIQVPTDPRTDYAVGEEVNVVLKATMGLKAVWIAYVVPLLILLAVVLGLGGLGVGELVSALVGIVAAGLYYLVVWLLRDRLNDTYIFTVQKKSN
jgi:sigma-E factor negative regulatory protein RseC